MMRHLVPVVVAGAALLAAAPAAAESEAADTRELSHGYAMFHLAASRLSHIDKALWLKAEPETVTDLLEALATTMGELVASLEGYQDTPPAIRLDDTGLPRLEVEKRQSVYLARGLELGTPIFGRTGTDFERTLLLSLSAAINQQVHLLKVMQDDEPAEPRKAWLRDAHAQLKALYERFVERLDADYFCAPSG